MTERGSGLELAPLYEVLVTTRGEVDGDGADSKAWKKLHLLCLTDQVCTYNHRTGATEFVRLRALSRCSKMGDSVYVRNLAKRVYFIAELDHAHTLSFEDSKFTQWLPESRPPSDDHCDGDERAAFAMLGQDLQPIVLTRGDVEVHHWDSYVYKLVLDTAGASTRGTKRSVLVRPCVELCRDNCDFGAYRGSEGRAPPPPVAFFTGMQ